MKSALAIDTVLYGFFSHELETYRENENLRNAILHYDFQDTECDNQTECYFYFSNKLSMDEVRKFGLRIHKILGIEDTDYEWMIEDQTAEGNPAIRLSIICSVEI